MVDGNDNLKNNAKGCLGALLTAAILAALFASGFLLITRKFAKVVYIGHRVRGSLTVTLNDEPYDITDLTIEGEGLGRPRIRYLGNRVEYSVLGNEYCIYYFNFELEGDLPDVRIRLEHFNWWDITTDNVELFLETDEHGEICYTYHNSGGFLGEDIKWHRFDYERDRVKYPEDNVITIAFDEPIK